MEENYNLLTREALEEVILKKDAQIKSVHRRYRKLLKPIIALNTFLIYAVGIPFVVTSFDLTTYLKNKQIVYGLFVACFILLVTSIYTVVKINKFIWQSTPSPETQTFKLEKELLVEDYTIEQLNQELSKAIENEDYEYSALLRDELARR